MLFIFYPQRLVYDISHVPQETEYYLHKYQMLNIKLKVQSSPTGHAGPEGSRRVKAPSFRDDTVMVVGCQPYAPAAFTPRIIPDDSKHTWYSFLLEAESTPGP